MKFEQQFYLQRYFKLTLTHVGNVRPVDVSAFFILLPSTGSYLYHLRHLLRNACTIRITFGHNVVC